MYGNLHRQKFFSSFGLDLPSTFDDINIKFENEPFFTRLKKVMLLMVAFLCISNSLSLRKKICKIVLLTIVDVVYLKTIVLSTFCLIIKMLSYSFISF